jgi:hypothetical protein
MKIAKALKGMVAALVVAGALAMAPAAAHAAVFVSAGIAPPPIPYYAQPLAPGYGYIWTPGYWAYGPDGYYWVDGAWVYPPYVDALWTPGYWGWGDDAYFWNPGYWGLNVGYYGGINYGFGYFGTGFYGCYWNGGHLFYNSAYNHIGFHNGYIYNHPVAGFDGRPGGAAFARNDGNRGGSFNRGAGINGHSFAGRSNGQVNFRNGYTGNGARPQVNSGAARSFNGNAGRPAYNGSAGFEGRASAPAAAPQSRSFSGGASAGGHANFSGGGGGGGGFHGGGGGGGGSHGGGRR